VHGAGVEEALERRELTGSDGRTDDARRGGVDDDEQDLRHSIELTIQFPVLSSPFPVSGTEPVWQLETGNWQLATGNWKLATGNWKLETGNWKLETG
jgi:hypothetical protein